MPDNDTHDIPDPAINYVNQLIRDAIRTHTSDIHIEPEAQEYRIRLRRQGALSHIATLPTQTAIRIIAHLKVLGNLDVSEKRHPQDGSYFDVDHQVNFRLNTLPTVHGEKLVLRLLRSSHHLIPLEQLGMQANQLQQFKNSLNKPHGLIIITGPTGCGKTTTLYAALQYLNTIDKNIITIENPVEIKLPHINQVNIHPEINLTFPLILRSILRQDPDIIMVGEIRDLLSAEIAIQAAQTGHLVLTTLHTHDAVSAFQRLASLGIAMHDLTSAVTLIMAQRLVRLQNPNSSRTGIFELLSMSPWLADALTSNLSSHQLQASLNQHHHQTLQHAANQLIRQTTLATDEMKRVIG